MRIPPFLSAFFFLVPIMRLAEAAEGREGVHFLNAESEPDVVPFLATMKLLEAMHKGKKNCPLSHPCRR
jgi:hypothetical protein